MTKAIMCLREKYGEGKGEEKEDGEKWGEKEKVWQ